MDTPAGMASRRSLAVAVLVAACLTSCGNGNGNGNRNGADGGSTRTVAPSPDVDGSSRPPEGEEIVIRTRIEGFHGKVLTGSVLGAAAFCRGGTVRHEHGSLEVGFPAVNVVECQSGSLSIGFGPGPDQMDQAVQTSDWRVLEGTGDFAGSTGAGTMSVRFDGGAELVGHETFSGVVVVP